MPQSIILSGIQPTGNLHIGNYLGAIRNIVNLQNSGDYTVYYFIADLHTLTSNQTPNERREQIMATAAELIAAGIDPERTTLFVQSHVPEHTELAWILSCTTPVSELERMTQFKDKSQKQDKNINAGLLNYPILQAADILLYKGNLIPVGQDQVQHVELTRDCARWFNNRYGDYFPEVKHLLTETPKIMGLLEPTKKMSKSDGPDNVLYLADELPTLQTKLKRAVTATAGGNEISPGVANLLLLLRQFGAHDAADQFSKAQSDGTIRYSDLKMSLAETIAATFEPFRTKRAELLANRDYLATILERGTQKARKVAKETMNDVRALIGLR
jgi:tryptophanyl-tRNA synthetase